MLRGRAPQWNPSAFVKVLLPLALMPCRVTFPTDRQEVYYPEAPTWPAEVLHEYVHREAAEVRIKQALRAADALQQDAPGPSVGDEPPPDDEAGPSAGPSQPQEEDQPPPPPEEPLPPPPPEAPLPPPPPPPSHEGGEEQPEQQQQPQEGSGRDPQ